MNLLLLAVIYLSFISLGFGSSLIGVAWPSLQSELDLPTAWGGYISTARTLAVIVACYLLGRIARRLSTEKIGLLACLLMLASWIGFALAPSYIWLLLSALPLGFGGGLLDSAFNDYMALHYSANQMNLLHSFWGIGSIVGPLLMSGLVSRPGGWRLAFFWIAGIEVFIIIVLLCSLPLWRRVRQQETGGESGDHRLPAGDYRQQNAHLHPLKMKGMPCSVACFFLYNGLETCIAMWTAGRLIETFNLDAARAAAMVSFYFLGIWLARTGSGFVANRLGNPRLLKLSMLILLVGAVLFAIPVLVVQQAALIICGLGSGPIMPTMIHESPKRLSLIHISEPTRRPG